MRRNLVLSGLLALTSAPAAAQSLWLAPGASERSSISDLVAHRVGDVITVVIRENQRVQDNGRLEVSKESGVDSRLEVFDINPDTFSTLPAVKYSSAREVDGESRYSQDGRFETTLSAVVIDVKSAGTLLIEGYRTIRIGGEHKRMSVRGLVRTIDIGADNSISSDRIANAAVLYETDGPRSRATEKNWFENLVDLLWPF